MRRYPLHAGRVAIDVLSIRATDIRHATRAGSITQRIAQDPEVRARHAPVAVQICILVVAAEARAQDEEIHPVDDAAVVEVRCVASMHRMPEIDPASAGVAGLQRRPTLAVLQVLWCRDHARSLWMV